MAFERPTAFVTGGTGFVGSHLVEELRRRDYGTVRCLVRREPKWLAGLDVEVVRGDLDDEATIVEAVRDVDYVYHVAGVTRARNEGAFRSANVDATVRLVRAVARVNPDVRKVLVTSSLAAVGTCAEAVATEDSPLHPISRYGASKAAMEEALATEAHGLPLVVVRPSAVYGPREADIFTFIKTVRRGLCPIVGSGQEEDLSLVHVRDLVRGMVDAAEREVTAGETYFLGSDSCYSWLEVRDAVTAALGSRALTLRVPPGVIGAVGALVEAAASIFGIYPPLNREKAREIRYACKMCTVARARRDFGYRQEIPLNEGMRETVAWYREQGWL